MADCQTEQVDHLLGVRADQMGSEDSVGGLLDQHLVAVDPFG